MAKSIITEADVLEASGRGGTSMAVPAGKALITPQARDRAAELGMAIVFDDATSEKTPSASPNTKAAALDPATGDVAAEVTAILRSRLPSHVEASTLEAMVRDTIKARLSHPNPSEKPAAMESPFPEALQIAAGVRLISGNKLLGSSQGNAPGQVGMAEAMGAADGGQLAAGYIQWEKSSFNRTVESPEVCIVIEGELQLKVGGETLSANAGDMLYLPKGAEVLYSAPGKVRLACVNTSKDA